MLLMTFLGLGLGRLLQRLEEFRVTGFQVFHDFPVVAFDFADVNLLDMHQPQLLLRRAGHFAAVSVAGAAALGYADLGPELLLVESEFASDFACVYGFCFHCSPSLWQRYI